MLCDFKDFPPHRGVLSVPFFFDGEFLQAAPRCCLSLESVGSMRFRWTEENPNRKNFFAQQGITEPIRPSEFSEKLCPGSLYPDFPLSGKKETEGKYAVPLELIHSQVVYALKEDDRGKPALLAKKQAEHPLAVDLLRGDGVITTCERFVPVVTVADCVPIYLFDTKTNCFGVVHSGWKGTGIAAEAITLAEKVYGSKPADFAVALGPHIHACCYTVEAERARYFIQNFGADCIERGNRLSLAEANVISLTKIGVLKENILHINECTCCNPLLGSFRRQAAELDLPLQEKTKHFTAMAAYIL